VLPVVWLHPAYLSAADKRMGLVKLGVIPPLVTCLRHENQDVCHASTQPRSELYAGPMAGLRGSP
jgi:hypothetical protein